MNIQLQPSVAKKKLSKDKIPLQLLPVEVIDRILVYLFPVSVENSISNALLDILPLATTCQLMFSRMAEIAAPYFTSVSMHAKEHVLRLPHLMETDPVRRRLLFQLASISIKKIALQLPYNYHQQREINAMLKNLANINAETSSEIRFRLKKCSRNISLFHTEGHTAKCCTRLAWTAFLVSSNSKPYLHLDMKWKCLSKLCQLLNLPVQKIFLKDMCASVNEIQENLQPFSSTVTDLSVKISQDLFKAISRTPLPNLKSLTITGSCNSENLSERCHALTLNQVLRQLRDNGSQLTSIRLGSDWMYSNGYEGINAIDLNNLGPTVRHLTIFFAIGRPYDRHIISSSLFHKALRFCQNIETFECLSYDLNFEVLTAFHHSGIFPNLRRILLRDMLYIYFQPLSGIMNETIETKETAKLIEEYELVRYLGTGNTDSMDFLLSNPHQIQRLSLRFQTSNVPDFIQLLRKCHRLTSLNFKIFIENNGEHVCYHSQDLTRAIFETSSSLEELDISTCMNIDQSIISLKAMGHRARTFRVPITDEDVRIFEMIRLRFCSLDAVVKILDTIEVYCPNLENIKIFDHRTICEWDSECFDIVEGKMKSLKVAMKSLQNSFFEDWNIIKEKNLRTGHTTA